MGTFEQGDKVVLFIAAPYDVCVPGNNGQFDTNFDVLGLFRFVTEVEHLPSVIREQHQPQRLTSSPVAAAASAESAPPAAAESPAVANVGASVLLRARSLKREGADSTGDVRSFQCSRNRHPLGPFHHEVRVLC